MREKNAGRNEQKRRRILKIAAAAMNSGVRSKLKSDLNPKTQTVGGILPA